MIIGALLISACLSTLPAQAADADLVELFVREGCPHCAKAEGLVERLAQEQPDLRICIRDVQKEAAALERLQQIARAQGTGAARVPASFGRGH